MKYRYIGECQAGFVQFKRELETVVMPQGEPVEVPAWLAKKFDGMGPNNGHFEKVEESPVEKFTTEPPAGTAEPVPADESKPRKKPGRKPKAQSDADSP